VNIIKQINGFVKQFNAKIPYDESNTIKNGNRFYLLSEKLKKQIPKDFFYAGAYLGTVKGSSFFPSFLLLKMISEKKANKLIVNKKTAWLFICGRDIFKKGIFKGNKLKKGDYALILNERNECLGFGKMTCNLWEKIDARKVVVKNILDIGDFLRREKRK
jgi:ribosome biogenesis protein Nip4